MSGVSVVIPAYNEQERVGDTVRAASALAGVKQVTVVDDGSRDETARIARQAGAQVIRLPKNLGKGTAIKRGLAQAEGEIILLLDADLGSTASEAAKLLGPVVRGEADLTIARFPPVRKRRGLGIATITGLLGIRLLAGLKTESPLCGQRAIRRELLDRIAIPGGFGVEVGMTIQAAWLGARIQEIPVEMSHARSGRDWAGRLHRARQFRDICLALAPLFLRRAHSHWLAAYIPLLAIGVAAIWLWEIEVRVKGAPLGMFRFGASTMSAPATLAFLLAALALRRRWPVQVVNYRSQTIPSALGLVFVFGWAAMFGPLIFSPRQWPLPVLGCFIAIAIAGWIDDRYGSFPSRGSAKLPSTKLLRLRSGQVRAGTTSGFRGHLRSLRQGRLTTGTVKIIVIGVAAWALGALLATEHSGLRLLPAIWPGLLNGILIALSANAINLLDLRPGRALKAFLAASIAIIAISATGPHLLFLLLLIAVIVPLLIYAPIDLRGRGMMGDTGSNFLGALLGFSVAATASLPVKLAIVLALIAFHLYCEKYSLTQAIERNSLLRWLDRLGRAVPLE